MNLKNHIQWNEWLKQYLLQQGIEMFDWKVAHKAEHERISKITLEEQEEELERAVREFEAMYGVDDFDYNDFNDFEEDENELTNYFTPFKRSK